MTSSTDVVVSPTADRNLREILTYTEKQWGTGQRDAYRQVLEAAFRRLGDFPEIGRLVEGRAPNLREYVLPHHIIVYRREQGRVVILRVVNPRRRR